MDSDIEAKLQMAAFNVIDMGSDILCFLWNWTLNLIFM